MTHQSPPAAPPPGADPGRQVAQLREALRLVERIAGQSESASRDARLDEAARISEAYARALPVARRRFEALAAETSVWAAAGVEALLIAGEDAPRAAAARLAHSLERALSEMAALLGPATPSP
ncbi:MAG: hypothetical protein QOG13_1087 [Sphingomonadales bacterium]|jgi:glycosyltransferase A (GT-A) superfamily protein (DUF2064 family)|nr:hypothetical protein [Sphingomonadales bacterium]MEA3045491.1 hypothetical protein [Sphingomonadales bacterium]